MPYGVRREVAVKIASITGLLYAFKTDVDTTTSTILGHVEAVTSGVYKRGVIFGINNPRPPRAKKLFASNNKRYEESYVDNDKIDDARRAGWDVKPGKLLSLRNTNFSKIVHVDFKAEDEVLAQEGVAAAAAITLKYAWRMPQYQYAKLTTADKTALGIGEFDGAHRNQYVMGAKGVKPNRARKSITVGTGNDVRILVIETFVAYNKEAALLAANNTTGWALIS